MSEHRPALHVLCGKVAAGKSTLCEPLATPRTVSGRSLARVSAGKREVGGRPAMEGRTNARDEQLL